MRRRFCLALLPFLAACLDQLTPFAPPVEDLADPPLVEDPADAPKSPYQGFSLVYGSCFEWGWTPAFEDDCLSGGLTVVADGTDRRFAATSAFGDTDPAWSPDGSKIAFAGYRHCDANAAEVCLPDIYVMNADGSGVRRLTNFTGVASTYSPTWSPDGSRIAFALWLETPDEPRDLLYVMNADGSGLASLAGLAGSSPSWSPDGARMAFSAIDDSGRSAIHIADWDGSNLVAVTAPANLAGDPANDSRPAWSPDGRRIAFTRSLRHPAGNGSCQVFVIDADGSNTVQVTRDSFCAHHPAWLPDGSRISYNGYEGATYSGRNGIMLVNPDGTDAVLVRRTEAWPSRAAWIDAR